LAGLVGAAEDHIVDGVPVDARIALHEGAQGDGAEVVGADGGQRPAEAADWGADVVADIGFGHDCGPPSSALRAPSPTEGRRRRLRALGSMAFSPPWEKVA